MALITALLYMLLASFSDAKRRVVLEAVASRRWASSREDRTQAGSWFAGWLVGWPAAPVWLAGILIHLWYEIYIVQYMQHIYGIFTVHVYSTSSVSLQYLYNISLDMTHLRVLLVLTDRGNNNNNNNAYAYAGTTSFYGWRLSCEHLTLLMTYN